MYKSKQIFSYINIKRIEKGISRKELAQMIGCSSRLIYYWENGKRGMSLDMADKALKVLGISYTLGEDERR